MQVFMHKNGIILSDFFYQNIKSFWQKICLILTVSVELPSVKDLKKSVKWPKYKLQLRIILKQQTGVTKFAARLFFILFLAHET